MSDAPIPVNVDNFVRAETDLYFSRKVAESGVGRLDHARQPPAIDHQDVVRMNRDTLYSSGVFDLDAGPVTVILPEVGRRFMSLQVISQDHYTIDDTYAPLTRTYDREQVGTRYVMLLVRTLVDPQDPADIAAVHALQDRIQARQDHPGTFETPGWDQSSQDKARAALSALGALGGGGVKFGSRDEVDPIGWRIGAAVGWGGNPPDSAVYTGEHPARNDGRTVHVLTVRDVPVDGFWSISVYDADGFFAKNDRDAYSLNNLTAKPEADGSYRIQFGGCGDGVANCLPIMPGWNYTVRLYRPRAEILNGTWKFPLAQPVD